MGDLPDNEAGWRKLRARIAALTRQPDQAEDLLHTAYLRLESYRSRAAVQNPSAYLVKAAVNLSVDQRRHERAKRQLPVPLHDLLSISDNHPLQDEVLATRRRLDHVRKGVERLPSRTRQIFLMHRVDGFKYREIAEELGISLSAVEKHVAKAAFFLAEWSEGW